MQDFSDDLSYEISMMQKYPRTATVVVIQPPEVVSVQDRFLDPSDDKKTHILQNLSVERSRYLEITFIAADGQSHVIVLESNPSLYRPWEEPLHSRGWVLQEQLLCPRVLIFPSIGDMIWQCDTIETFSSKVLYYPLDLQGRSRLLQYSRPKSVYEKIQYDRRGNQNVLVDDRA